MNKILSKRSNKWKLNIRDISKSVITGLLTAFVAALYQIIETQQLNGEVTITTAIMSVVAYLLKNLIEDKNGNIIDDQNKKK